MTVGSAQAYVSPDAAAFRESGVRQKSLSIVKRERLDQGSQNLVRCMYFTALFDRALFNEWVSMTWVRY